MTAPDKDTGTPLTMAQLETILERQAERSAEKTVNRVMTSFGLDPSDPIQLQEDFADLRSMRKMFRDEEYQKDRAHLRKWRTNSEKMAGFSMAALISTVVAGVMALLLAGYQTILGHAPTPH